MLSDETPPTEEHTVYIGSAETAAGLMAKGKLPSRTMLLLSGDQPELEEPLRRNDIACFFCRCSLQEILNRANSCFFEFSKWINRLYLLACRSKDAQPLLDEAALRLHVPLFLLNSGYRLIASNVDYAFENAYMQQLLSFGYLSADSIDTFLHSPLPGRKTAASPQDVYEALLEPNSYGILAQLKYRTNTFGRLLVFTEANERDAVLFDYVKILVSLIREHSLINNREQFESDTEFSALIGDLIERKISGEEELNSRLFRLPVLPPSYYTCIVVCFEPNQKALPTGLILHALSEIFPLSQTAVYQGDLILLAKTQKGIWEVSFDKERLQKLLERHHAYASIGNQSSFISSIRPIYLQTKEAIALGRALSSDPRQRLFYYDDYTTYHLIDLCQRFGYDFHENNLIYLCTPKYTILKRHDIEEKDNLCEILEVYIQNNCNTTKTAKDLYLHRNTVINKISRIEEIIGRSLDDWNLQMMLMLSSMVLKYAEKYRKEDLLHPVKKYSPAPGET
ncbi:PucR family transcriptional regulator [Hominifimenecus sp. rT4P-3]|uniref:PucR family transcriptional regulator n=1 Tax=Hominifimenecus sp. rT4P-3 TaxID=3242979 RepID=UPI003DA3B2B1